MLSTELYLTIGSTNFTAIFTRVTTDNTQTHWLQRFEFYIIVSSVILIAATTTISLMVFMFCLKMCHCKKDGTTSTVSNTVETRSPEPIYESIADETSRGQELDGRLCLVANDAYSVKCSIGLVANDAYTIKYSFSNMVSIIVYDIV